MTVRKSKAPAFPSSTHVQDIACIVMSHSPKLTELPAAAQGKVFESLVPTTTKVPVRLSPEQAISTAVQSCLPHSQTENNGIDQHLSTLSDGVHCSIRRAKAVRKNVLYAEDDKSIREMMMRLLTYAGYNITPVADGLEALGALNAGAFDLLITDNDMPQLSGVELVARLRRNQITLPIILASGSADFFRGDEFRWLNFAGYLQKPFIPDKLLETVRRVLNTASDS